jgi:hypothetical protein
MALSRIDRGFPCRRGKLLASYRQWMSFARTALELADQDAAFFRPLANLEWLELV